VFEWLPDWLMMFVTRRLISGETAATKLGHAEQGRAEWLLLADELRELIAKAGIPTPAIDVAFQHLGAA
jgi:hypothetical protein